MEIEIEKIIVGQRFRGASAVKVLELADSIQEIGLLEPIVVASENGGYRLVAGLHRLEAFRRLGRATIPAQVIEGDKNDLELAEIDENLKRAELTVLEQGELMIRREAILHERGERAKRGDNRFTRSRGETVSPLQTTADIAKERWF